VWVLSGKTNIDSHPFQKLNHMRINHISLPLAIGALFALSCEHEGGETTKTYYHGVYVVNEGGFSANNGSISFFDPGEGTITNNIFEAANGRPLGDVVQSFAVVQDTTGYIVVNGSGKVEIVSLRSFKATAPPIPVVYPRFFMQVNAGKGYLTAGSMEGSVYVVDLETRIIDDTIPVGKGPEIMMQLGDKVFVVNSGGWDTDSTISVIDVATDQVVSQITVPKIPVDMVIDGDNMLWVYCKGQALYSWDPPYDLISETDAVVVKIDPATGDIVWQGVVGRAGDYTATPPRIAVSRFGDKICYLRPEGMYIIQADSPATGNTPLIEGNFYGLDVDPSNDLIYLFEGGFTGDGTMQVYNMNGTLQGMGSVGIAPNGAAFSTE
jgi:YVTN family beta-propeller protein